jgi:hypothetical protein
MTWDIEHTFAVLVHMKGMKNSPRIFAKDSKYIKTVGFKSRGGLEYICGIKPGPTTLETGARLVS